MTALDDIMQLKAQGLQDSEIIQALRDRGVSPRDINDALSQARVKEAIQQNSEESEMQPSIMPAEGEQPQQYVQYPEAAAPGAEAPAEFYPGAPQAYGGEAYYPEAASFSTETISEIAEQIVSEKFSEFKEKTGDIVTFKNETLDRIKDLDERVKRIERNMDKLQQAVIGKIGAFGEASENINKDLSALHDTVSKLANPLMDAYNKFRQSAPGADANEPGKKKQRPKIDELVGE